MLKIRKIVIIIISIVILIIMSVALLYYNRKKIIYATITYNSNDADQNISDIYIKEEVEVLPEVLEANIPIFMYHSITDDLSYIEFSQNAISPLTLEKQLETIVKGKYEPIFVSDLDRIGKYDKPIALTFDDGFEDFYINAYPLLKKYNIKATLFIVVGYINCDNYCTLDQLKEMKASSLISIESHTLSHANLANISNEKEIEEINKSTEILNDYLDKQDSEVFCYPYGVYSNDALELIKKKYKYAVIMGDKIYDIKKHDNYAIPRIIMNRDTTLQTFNDYLTKSSLLTKQI